MLVVVLALAAAAAAAVGIATRNDPLLWVASACGLGALAVVVSSTPTLRWPRQDDHSRNGDGARDEDGGGELTSSALPDCPQEVEHTSSDNDNRNAGARLAPDHSGVGREIGEVRTGSPVREAPTARRQHRDGPSAATDDGLVAVMSERRRYHRPTCSLIADRERVLITEEEAQAEGFSPCTHCRE